MPAPDRVATRSRFSADTALRGLALRRANSDRRERRRDAWKPKSGGAVDVAGLADVTAGCCMALLGRDRGRGGSIRPLLTVGEGLQPAQRFSREHHFPWLHPHLLSR